MEKCDKIVSRAHSGPSVQGKRRGRREKEKEKRWKMTDKEMSKWER